MKTNIQWTSDELEELKISFHKLSNSELEIKFGREYRIIKRKAYSIGIKPIHRYERLYLKNKNLLKNTENYTLEELSKILDLEGYESNIRNVRTFLNSKNLKYKKFNTVKVNDNIECFRCKEIKTYNNDNFTINSHHYICRMCTNLSIYKSNLKKKNNIFLNNDGDKSLEEWVHLILNKNISKFPRKLINKDNLRYIIRYIYMELLDCKSKEDILNITTNDLKVFKLKERIQKYYGNLPNMLFEVFEDFNIKVYDLRILPKNYLDNKNNFNYYVKELSNKFILENKITNIKKELPYYFRVSFLFDNGYTSLASADYYKKHYDNYYQCLSSIFPEIKFEESDFSIPIYKNLTFDSYEEMEVYKQLEQFENINIVNVTKNSQEYKFYNSLEDEYYIPDFILSHNNTYIVCEYFGLYNSNNSHEIFIEYANKTKRKCEYFYNLDDYLFLPIYPIDLYKNNTQNKLSELLNS